MHLSITTVIPLSDKQERDSFGVAKYLLSKGYNVIPVNPSLESWQGIKSYPNLSSIPKNTRLDIVNIFRKPEAVGEIVEESIKVKPKAIWICLLEGYILNLYARIILTSVPPRISLLLRMTHVHAWRQNSSVSTVWAICF